MWSCLCSTWASVHPSVVLFVTGPARVLYGRVFTPVWSGLLQGQREYYMGELELNEKLRTFAVNCSLLYGGHNTVQAQLKFKSKRRK